MALDEERGRQAQTSRVAATERARFSRSSSEFAPANAARTSHIAEVERSSSLGASDVHPTRSSYDWSSELKQHPLDDDATMYLESSLIESIEEANTVVPTSLHAHESVTSFLAPTPVAARSDKAPSPGRHDSVTTFVAQPSHVEATELTYVPTREVEAGELLPSADEETSAFDASLERSHAKNDWFEGTEAPSDSEQGKTLNYDAIKRYLSGGTLVSGTTATKDPTKLAEASPAGDLFDSAQRWNRAALERTVVLSDAIGERPVDSLLYRIEDVQRAAEEREKTRRSSHELLAASPLARASVALGAQSVLDGSYSRMQKASSSGLHWTPLNPPHVSERLKLVLMSLAVVVPVLVTAVVAVVAVMFIRDRHERTSVTAEPPTPVLVSTPQITPEPSTFVIAPPPPAVMERAAPVADPAPSPRTATTTTSPAKVATPSNTTPTKTAPATPRAGVPTSSAPAQHKNAAKKVGGKTVEQILVELGEEQLRR